MTTPQTKRRPRVDWDAEIRKTEKIRRKGLLMSALSFAMACAFIFGMHKYTGASVEIPKTVLFAVVFVVSCVIFAKVMKRRKKKKNAA